MNEEINKALEAVDGSAMRSALKAIEAARPSIDSYRLPELRMPDVHFPKMPTQEEVNEYQSASALMRRLAKSILQWRTQLPTDQQPAILALLYGGVQIHVERLAQESFHGIRIEGKISGNPCMVLAHQAGVQLLCYVEKIEQETSRRKIGFIIDGEEQQV